MSIQSDPRSKAYESIVIDALEHTKKNPVFGDKNPLSRSESFSILAPHEIYATGITTILEGDPLTGAKKTGWRYLIRDQDGPFADVVLRKKEGGEDFKFSSLNFSQLAEVIVRGLGSAEEFDIVNKNDYTLRLFESPDITFISLWLKGESDRFIPVWFDSEPAPFLDEPLTEDEFILLLTEKAKAAADKYNSKNK
jgi:hypothetical protein